MTTIKVVLIVSALALVTAAGARAQDDILSCGGIIQDQNLKVQRTESLCEWPFDVEAMEIGCDGWGARSGELYFISEKGRFGLNGSGKTRYGDPRELWLDANGWAGGKVSVQPWIDAGLGLCR